MNFKLVKRVDASELLLITFISGIVTILSIRIILELTNNFQLGRGQWHLAHVLYGGLGMLIGGMLPQLFHGDRVRRLSAVIMGAGMGSFIDEIGKFVTRDNNYFFQPAILLIYGFFVLMFLIYRYIERINPKDPKTLLYQTISELEEVAENDLDQKEKDEMIRRLSMVIRRERNVAEATFGKHLLKLVENLTVVAHPNQNLLLRLYRRLRWFSYYKIFKKKVVWFLLLALAIGDIIGSIFNTYQVITWRQTGYNLASLVEQKVAYPKFDSFMEGSKIVVDGLAALLFLGGLVWVSNKKIKRGIFYFQTGLLVNIFLGSMFNFYFEQFSAVIGLGANIVILMGISRLKRDFLV